MAEQQQWQLAGSAPEIYERYLVPAFFAGFAGQLLDRAALRPGERVLDIACGTGIVAREAAKRVGATGSVTGLDLNPGMLTVARAQAVEGATVTWHEGSALELPFPANSFDVVLCQQGLQYFPDKPAALMEMHRVLAADGRLALAVWAAIEQSPGFAALATALGHHIGTEAEAAMQAPFALSDAKALQAMVSDAGFNAVSVHLVNGLASFPSVERFALTVLPASPVAPLFAQATDAARLALVEEVSKTLGVSAESHELRFTMQTLIATARA